MIKINKRLIGKNKPPFLIAEMSANHQQSLKKAFKIIKQASKCGVDAIKIQTFTPENMTMNFNSGKFKISNSKSLWKGKNLYQLYKEACMPLNWIKPLFKYSQENNIICFSSIFDLDSITILEKNNCPAYKIASFENNHFPLIDELAKLKKPLLISLGMAKLKEIEEIVNICLKRGCNKIILLKCTSAYPATEKDANVITIPYLRKHFNLEVGISDHTLGIGTSIAAVSHGATVVEKHFILDKKEGGLDSAFSLEPHDFKMLKEETTRAWLSLGSIKFGSSKNEKKSEIFRRSIYTAKDLKVGDLLSKKNIKIIRPGDGLHPKYFDKLIGKKVIKNIKKGKKMTWDVIR